MNATALRYRAVLLLLGLGGFGLLQGWQKAAWPPPLQKVAENSPALPVDKALQTFFLPPGYKLEVVAAEPMVQDPIVIDMDADGRMYVVEMPAFAMDESMRDSMEPICRVVLLEDTDDDGKMDKRTVFLDKLVLPRAVKALADGVLVGEPPNLWLARDTNGDGKADTKELVRNDFGRADANIEHNANGLLWGMDNTIYTSEHTWNLKWKGGAFERLPSLSRGQWNISMDDAGRIYRNWNEQPLFVDYTPVHYFMRNPNVVRTRGLYDVLIERNETAIWPVRPTIGIQRGYREGMLRPDGTATTYASSADPLIFRGDRLPKELQGNAFVSDSPTNLVHRLIVTDDGTGRLKARDAYAKGEFLASTDERFRPANLYGAPDGTFYVIDMYRGVVQDIAYQTDYLKDYIKTRKLELPVGLGRIYRVTHESMKRGPKPALSKANADELIRALSHPNGWWRDTAQQMLVQKQMTAAAPRLKLVATTAPDYRTRLHALWTLDGLDALDPATVEKALNDKSTDVRASGIRLAERWLGEGSHPLQKAVLKHMNDSSWTVRRQLTASLGALPKEARLDPLTQMIEKYGDDPILVDAAVTSLNGLESEMLDRLLPSKNVKTDAITVLAGAVSRSRDFESTIRLMDKGAESARPAAVRTALLSGVEMGLQGGSGGGGGRPPGTGPARAGLGGAGAQVAFPREPGALAKLIAEGGEMADIATRISARVSWPGKPAPVVTVAKLTPAEERMFADGAKLYSRDCAGCHQTDGQGKQNMAPALVRSRYVTGSPAVATRILLAGKEGTAMMPPFRATYTDEQIASVLTFLRREWGHTASPVSAAEVQEVRGLTASHKKPWTEAELAPLLAGPRFGGAARRPQ